jgi:uncharacterized protein YndB with AHSA1/START domain
MTSVAKPGAARAIADLDRSTSLAQVEIAAPPERVFTALTDPAEVVRWWGQRTGPRPASSSHRRVVSASSGK